MSELAIHLLRGFVGITIVWLAAFLAYQAAGLSLLGVREARTPRAWWAALAFMAAFLLVLDEINYWNTLRDARSPAGGWVVVTGFGWPGYLFPLVLMALAGWAVARFKHGPRLRLQTWQNACRDLVLQRARTTPNEVHQLQQEGRMLAEHFPWFLRAQIQRELQALVERTASTPPVPVTRSDAESCRRALEAGDWVTVYKMWQAAATRGAVEQLLTLGEWTEFFELMADPTSSEQTTEAVLDAMKILGALPGAREEIIRRRRAVLSFKRQRVAQSTQLVEEDVEARNWFSAERSGTSAGG